MFPVKQYQVCNQLPQPGGGRWYAKTSEVHGELHMFPVENINSEINSPSAPRPTRDKKNDVRGTGKPYHGHKEITLNSLCPWYG